MWEKEFTEELTTLYDLYEDKFDYPPDEYEELEFSTIPYDEFVAYLKISLKNNIELEEAMDYYYVLKTVLNKEEYGKKAMRCPYCSNIMVIKKEKDNSYTFECKKNNCTSVNLERPK